MENQGLQQTRKMQGSFVNSLMGNNSSIPKEGDWATICHYSDRSVVKVHKVSEGGKRVTLEYCDTTHDKTKEGGMGHQNWVHKPTGHFYDIVYRNGAWRKEVVSYVFTDEFMKRADEAGSWPAGMLTEKQQREVYGDPDSKEYTCYPIKEVEGITKVKKSFPKTSIMFGVCDYHYDWTF